MALIVGMATGITLIQIIGAYLRYLPFEARLLPEERARLWRYILLWTPVTFAIYVAYFCHAGLDVASFKHVQYFGWVPFFTFSLVVIRHGAMRHVFVTGMQALWFFLLHTMSGAVLLTLLPPFWQGLSHLNPIVYMISGFRYGFLGINDVPLVTTFGVLVVFIVAFYLICWSLIQRGRGLRS